MLHLATAVGKGSRHQLRETAGALVESQRDISHHLLPTQQICQPSPCPFTAQNVGQRFRAMSLTVLPKGITGHGQDGIYSSTGCPHPCSFSQLQVCMNFLSPHWHMQTLPRFVQQIFAKEKAILPLSLSLPPCQGAAGSVLACTGRRW